MLPGYEEFKEIICSKRNNKNGQNKADKLNAGAMAGAGNVLKLLPGPKQWERGPCDDG